MKKILIVEDDIEIHNLIKELLKREGYEIIDAYSGTEALLIIEKEKINLILLDLMLPGLNGEEIVEKVKNIPIIVISAKISAEDKVKDIVLNENKHAIYIKNMQIYLTKTEYAIMKQLLLNPMQVVTKSKLIDLISDDTQDGDENSLKVHISNIRKKIRRVTDKEYIESVWGIGFKLYE